MKISKIIYITLILLAFGNNFCLAKVAPETIKAKIEFTDKDFINLKLLPETIVDTDLSLAGDFFSAYLTKPSAEILRVPFGSRLIGEITEVTNQKSFNRDAKLKAHINKLMLPDGTIVKVSADLSSTADQAKQTEENSKFDKFKKNLKAVAKESSEIGAATIVGAMDSVQLLGLGTAISTSGISAGVGAAIGLGMGLTHSIGKKGDAIYNGFKPLNFQLISEFKLLETLPLSYQNLDPVSASLLGVDFKVTSMQKLFSKNYGEFIVVNFEITNRSDKKIFLGDFVLRSNTHILPVYSNPLLTNSYASYAEPQQVVKSSIAFSLGSYNKKDNYQLLILDPVNENIIADTEIKFSEFL